MWIDLGGTNIKVSQLNKYLTTEGDLPILLKRPSLQILDVTSSVPA